MHPSCIITNANTSGQGDCPAARSHPFTPTVEAFGYTYSHSTPVHLSGGGRCVYHTFKHSGHNVSLATLENTGEPRTLWDTSTSCASGRRWSGIGLPELQEHLKSKRRRYGLK